jgi:hypothetical protein
MLQAEAVAQEGMNSARSRPVPAIMLDTCLGLAAKSEGKHATSQHPLQVVVSLSAWNRHGRTRVA